MVATSFQSRRQMATENPWSWLISVGSASLVQMSCRKILNLWAGEDLLILYGQAAGNQ